MLFRSQKDRQVNNTATVQVYWIQLQVTDKELTSLHLLPLDPQQQLLCLPMKEPEDQISDPSSNVGPSSRQRTQRGGHHVTVSETTGSAEEHRF